MMDKKIEVVTVSIFDLLRLQMTIVIVFLTSFLPTAILGKAKCDLRIHEILRKYYTEDEINDNKIHLIEASTQLRLSNGVVLPREDYDYYQGGNKWYLAICVFLFYIVIDHYLLGRSNIKFFLWCFTQYSSHYNKDVKYEIKYQSASVYFEYLRQTKLPVSLDNSE
jgi:hypothetical protein